MQLVSEPLYSKFFLWLLVFFVRVLLSAVCKVILYSIVGIMMCIKAYCSATRGGHLSNYMWESTLVR